MDKHKAAETLAGKNDKSSKLAATPCTDKPCSSSNFDDIDCLIEEVEALLRVNRVDPTRKHMLKSPLYLQMKEEDLINWSHITGKRGARFHSGSCLSAPWQYCFTYP